MIDAQNMDRLLDMLAHWHRIEAGWQPTEGYPRECVYLRGYRVSRQYDDHDIQESDGRTKAAQHAGVVVMGMDEPWRTALCILARNRALGLSDWSSPRLPACEVARGELVAEALGMLEWAL